jgi:anti-anti-sigma factor
MSGQPAHRLELHAHPGEDHVVVQIWGELYTSRLNELTRVLDTQVRAGRTRVVLDISRLYDLDADAISILSRWQTALAAMGGCLWLAAPRPWVRRLLEHMCLRGTFKVFPTPLDAISALTAASASPVLPAAAVSTGS